MTRANRGVSLGARRLLFLTVAILNLEGKLTREYLDSITAFMLFEYRHWR